MVVTEQVFSEDALRELLCTLLRATKANQVEEVVQHLEKLGAAWRLVGDRNNYATIHVAANPSAAYVERVTNAIDARLELAAETRPELIEDCTSPRLFVERSFGVKDGYLSSLPPGKEREKLVEVGGLVVTLRDGDSNLTPTIDTRDYGIGISREEFPDTMLSLNRDNKIKKWYLMGRFGQGGSATFRFSKYTVVVSRRNHANGKNDDRVSFTVVRLRDPEKGEKDGQYVYLVCKHDNLPFSVPLDSSVFGPGTLVRHVSYELGRKTQPLLLDIYNILEFRLFDPVLPFWIEEQRSSVDNRGDRRRTFGSRDRLQRSELIERFDEHLASLDELGAVTLRYWVFKPGTDMKQKETFVDPDYPIVVTYLGQTHATLPKRILATECQLPNLYRDLAVQIDCDALSDAGRHKILSSTREVITEEGSTKFRIILAQILREELSDLDQEREQTLFSRGAEKAKDYLRRRLAEMINRIKPGTFNLTGGTGTGRTVKKVKRKHRKQYPPLPTKDFPTFVRIGNTKIPIRFGAGWITWIGVESDAPDDFLAKFSAKISLAKDAAKLCKVASTHRDFKGGRLSMGVTVQGDQPSNTQFKFGIALPVRQGEKAITFDDWKHAIIVPPYEGGGEKKAPLDVPEIVLVHSSSPFWQSNGWTDRNVAEVKEKEGHIAIYISTENTWLVGTLTSSKYTITAKEKLKTKYILNIAAFSYFQHEGIKDMLKASNGSGGSNFLNIPEEQLDTIRQRSLEWGARSILTALTSEEMLERDFDVL